MKTLTALLFCFVLTAASVLACKEENLNVGVTTNDSEIPEPAINHKSRLLPTKGYDLTSSMEADLSMSGQNHSALNNYMKNFGFEYSEHPNCTSGYGGHIDGTHCADVNIDMWRAGSSYIRNKFGIYRSLGGGRLNREPVDQSPLLKNESIWITDLMVYEKNTNPQPGLPHK